MSAEPGWFGLNLTRVRVSNADSGGGFTLIDVVRAHRIETMRVPGTMPGPPGTPENPPARP